MKHHIALFVERVQILLARRNRRISKTGVKFQFEGKHPKGGSVNALSKSRVGVVFLQEKVKRAQHSLVLRIVTRGAKTNAKVKHIITSKESVARHQGGIKSFLGGVVKAVDGAAAEVIANGQTAVLAPFRKRLERHQSRERLRVKAYGAGGGADVPLKSLIADVRNQQTVSHHFRRSIRRSHSKKRSEFYLL